MVLFDALIKYEFQKIFVIENMFVQIVLWDKIPLRGQKLTIS